MSEDNHYSEDLEETKKPKNIQKKNIINKSEAEKDRRKIKVLEMTAKEIPVVDISKATGFSPMTINSIVERFSKVFEHLNNVDRFRTKKTDFLAAGQMAALESAFSGRKMQKAGFLSTLQGFDILNKAERLENGDSTENVRHSFLGKLEIGFVIDSIKSDEIDLSKSEAIDIIDNVSQEND
jgi:hypothetical protein